MSRLRTPANVVSFAFKMRTEGMGIRASGGVLEKSHTSIMRWEQKLANQSQQWSLPAPAGADITVEGDEVYTRVVENLPPSESKGWTVTFIERKSRYWIEARVGVKTTELFAKAKKNSMAMGKNESIHPMVY